MKNLYLFLCLFLFSFNLSATHIIGGSLSYENLGGDEYKVRLEVLRDCYFGALDAPFDDPASIGIFTEDDLLWQEILIPFSGIDDTLTLEIPNNVCVFPIDICVHRTIYETVITLPQSVNYFTISYQRCCRSSVITNLLDPLDIGMTFHTQITPTQNNSSPQFNTGFPFAVFKDTPFSYDGSATDADGDSLVYELANPFYGGDLTFPQPQPPNNPPYDTIGFLNPPYSTSNMLGGNYPLAIDTETGEMSAIPTTLGVFQIAYSVKEYRDGDHIGTIYREFAFVVTHAMMSQNYDVSGEVLVNGQPLDIGKVQILERDVVTDSLHLYDEQMISNTAEYAFEDIPPGVFYIKAIVDSTSMYFDEYLPTYYDAAPFWYAAEPINQCDTSQENRDIHLLHIDDLNGDLVLDGLITIPTNGNIPAENLDLLLANESGDFVQARTTNSQGYFKFKNLEPGVYTLHADLINSQIFNLNPPIVELQENKTIHVLLHQDHLEIEDPDSAPFLPQQSALEIKFHPNPTNGFCALEMNLKASQKLSLRIYDLYGKEVKTFFDGKFFQEGISNEVLSLEALPNGTYFIEIQSDSVRIIKKIVKM